MKSIEWLAGYLEGEGAFSLRPKNKLPVIGVSSTDKDVLEEAALVCGVRRVYGPYCYRGHKPIYGLNVYGIKALAVMVACYPHLGQRRKATIRAVLDSWEHHTA